MPRLTTAHHTYEKPGIVLPYDLGATTIFKGSLVGLTILGRAAPLSPDQPMRFLGVGGETADPKEGARRVSVAKLGSFVFGCAGFVPRPSDIGRPVYAASDWEVQLAPDGLLFPVVVGTIVGIEPVTNGKDGRPLGEGVRIRIDLHTV